MGEKTGTYDQPGLCASYFRWYTSRFIFWVGIQVSVTGQAAATFPASYFGWENRYRSRVHPALHISAAPTLRFLRAEKRKHVRTTGLTCWHSCPRVTIFTSGKAKKGMCNRPDIAAAPALRFSRSKKRK